MAVFEVFTAVPAAASAWRQVRAAAARIAEAVPDTVPAGIPVATVPAVGTGPDLGDGIVLHGVSARWPAAREDALHDLDLSIAPGERVLVVGSSGAGKTTVAHVLVRFLDTVRGRYTIGGVDVADLDPDDVRETVGLCEQQPMLFDEDIRQNLLFAHDTATDAELEAVLERVGLGDWLHERGGLDARVGERGALVSGGQAQRVAIARAVANEPRLVLADEPTGNLDSRSGQIIYELLKEISRERTVIVVTHAENLAMLAERVIHIRDGKLSNGPDSPLSVTRASA